MKLSVEFKYGLFIFFGISSVFFIVKLLGLEKVEALRAINIFKVYYGIRCTLLANRDQNLLGFVYNIFSIFKTAFIGVSLSVIGLYIYVYINGGQEYLNQLSKGYFTGTNPTVIEYCFGMFSEGIASAVILTFMCMQFWNAKPPDKKC